METRFFLEDFEQRDRVDALREQDTRASKKAANELVNGAWKVHLARCYGRMQLGLMLLKHPPAAVETLLEEWRGYVASDAYQREKARAHRYRPHELTPEIEEEKRGQQQLKQQAHRFRHSFRLMRKYQRDLRLGRRDDVPAHHQDLYGRYMTGDLGRELDEVTVQHGYGQLRGRPERLGACGMLRPSPP